jgi:hypothetical protein
MRRTSLVSLAAAALAYGTVAAPPASAAPGGVAFLGTANIQCFGCANSQGNASLTVAGTVGGSLASGSATATYTGGPAGLSCLVSGNASGSVSGAVNLDFFWTRVGAVAVISTSGDITGQGVATFVVTSPLGIPCGTSVTAQVAGTVFGA